MDPETFLFITNTFLLPSRMFAQTAQQVHLDHPVSQESQGTKDTRDLQGKMVKMDTRYSRTQLLRFSHYNLTSPVMRGLL